MKKLTPNELKEILKKGISVSNEQASEILKLLRMFADIVVSNYLFEIKNHAPDKQHDTDQ